MNSHDMELVREYAESNSEHAFATNAGNGLQRHTFPIEPDGREHTYNIDMLQASKWSGKVLVLGVQPSDDTNAVATLSRLRVGSEPEGPPHLRVVSFSLDATHPRAGVPAILPPQPVNTRTPKAAPLKIAALAGDGSRPEALRDAIKVLQSVEKNYDLAPCKQVFRM